MRALVLGGDAKCLRPLGQEPMLKRIIECLWSAQVVKEALVVGPVAHSPWPLPPGIAWVQGGENLSQSLQIGWEALRRRGVGNREYILLLSGDMPLLSPRHLQEFLTDCQGEHDAYYPIVRQEDNDRLYPGVRRTYVRLAEGTFTGGNVFLIRAGVMDNCMDLLERFISARKQPWRLARLLGPTFLWRWWRQTLTIADIARKLQQLTGFSGQAVICPHPEIALDLDKEEDWLWLEKGQYF